MDFEHEETQQAAAQLTAELLRRPGPDHRAGWQAMAEAGLLGLAVPAELDGAGLGVLDTAAVLTEVGRQAARLPALATLGLGVLPVVRLGTDAQRAELLPEVAAGARLLTAALHEPSDPLPVIPSTVARPDGARHRLSGLKIGVRHAAEAHRILVPATSPDGGTGVFLVDPADDAVTPHRTPSSSGEPEYTVRLDRAPAERLGGDDLAVAELYRLAVATACALGDGLLAGALALTTEYVRSREQFGRPLATFQAVAQQIAEVYGTARGLHLAALSAGWRLATGRDADDDLAVAAYWLAEETPTALHICHHLHGGVGVDETYPLHRYSTQAKDLARFVGGAHRTLDRLGARIAG